LKILTAAEMREVDERTIARGIPGMILMENAGAGVVRYIERHCSPLAAQRVVIFCGKGNNGGDGFVAARQLFQRRLCAELTVVELYPKEELKGDAAAARGMLDAIGCPVQREIPERAFGATLVIDAILGTGVRGAATGRALEFIQLVNRRFPHAVKVAVDFPSGFPTDESEAVGEFVKVDHTVTFTALKRSQAFSPSYEGMGSLDVCPIGTPDALCEGASRYRLRLTSPADIAPLFKPRPKDSNKGIYGHVLVVAGSAPKPGAATMAGMSVLRAGAGLATVASPPQAAAIVAGSCSELMTEPLPETSTGHIAYAAKEVIEELLKNKTVLAIGPGLGTEEQTVALVRELYHSVEVPMIVDADALNGLAGSDLKTGKVRIMTPHPGEMGRLIGKSAKEVQKARLESAEALARESKAAIVLKGDRTVIAFAGGETWVNPTGSPAMATGGTGDVLTGMVAGLVAQHPEEWQRAVAAAVWLHGRAGELGGRDLGEQCLIATDLLRYLPAAMEECRAAGCH
jgi:NAD(P)H-hydrate epimerase